MKKITRMLLSLVTIALFTMVPISVYAQDDSGVISVESSTPATTSAGVPNTGAAPKNNLLAPSLIFISGSLVGAGIGLGIVTARKKRTNLY